jgi:ubiquitin C-terminal hydrolase
MWDEEPIKRTLGIRDKQILWERAGHKCQACGKELDFTEMQVGHKTAASKGGRATLRNCVCLCYKCNKLQGTDSWKVFLRKMGKQEDSRTKEILRGLTIKKLRFLAKRFNVKVRGRTEEGLFQDYSIPPSKTQYVNALAKRVSEKDIASALKEMPLTKKKKRRRNSGLF